MKGLRDLGEHVAHAKASKVGKDTYWILDVEFFPAGAGPADAGILGRADHPWSAGGALKFRRLNRRIRDDAPYRWWDFGFTKGVSFLLGLIRI